MKENSIENFKRALDMAEILGVEYVSTDTGEIENDEDKKRFYREINELADYAHSRNINICIEIHGNWFNNGKKGYNILKELPIPVSGLIMIQKHIRFTPVVKVCNNYLYTDYEKENFNFFR